MEIHIGVKGKVFKPFLLGSVGIDYVKMENYDSKPFPHV